MNLLDALLMSRKLKFEDGSITLYGEGAAILPLDGFIMYIGEISNDTEVAKLLYSTMRNSMLERSQKLITEAEGTKQAEWLCASVNVYGYGRIRYSKPTTAINGTLILEESPFTKILKGKATTPVDHIIRGAIAGIASAITGRDMHAVEAYCAVSDHDNCQLVLDSKEMLAKEFVELFNQQV